MIPLKFGTPLEYAQKFLDAPDSKHLEWTFGGAPIETDFNIIVKNDFIEVMGHEMDRPK